MDSVLEYGYTALDGGWIPDPALRVVIRQLCRKRLRDIEKGSLSANLDQKWALINRLSAPSAPLAIDQDKANQQHYEVPTSFLKLCLGPRMKYSSCLYPSGPEKAQLDPKAKPGSGKGETLSQAEDAMLESYLVKAKLPTKATKGPTGAEWTEKELTGEGLKLLDLGCGWGSLGLFLAEKYPSATIKMLSNSTTQKIYIDSVCKTKGYGNVEVITGDFTKYDFVEKPHFTHILSIEMFEHMKNYPALFQKCSTWLVDGGKMFIHVFCHKWMPYEFEEGDGWMSKTFFSGGTMPSLDLFTHFQEHLTLNKSWYIPGTHYGQTLESWLRLQDSNAKEGMKILEEDAEAKGFGKEEGRKSFYRFRVFFLACAEFFAMDGGETWGVAHYLFEKKPTGEAQVVGNGH